MLPCAGPDLFDTLGVSGLVRDRDQRNIPENPEAMGEYKQAERLGSTCMSKDQPDLWGY
jgi:hypothetical protein